MSKMTIFLPTRGRPFDQMTLGNLPPKWRRRTVVVCPKDEVSALKRQFPDVECVAYPLVTGGIAEKRRWILKRAERLGIERILMLDDDLRFHVRTYRDPTFAGYNADGKVWPLILSQCPDAAYVYRPKPDDKWLGRMFSRIESMLGVYAHGGINSKYMQHTEGCEFRIGGRYLHALGYNVPIMLKHCELARLELSTDYDYALQLMRAGYDSAVYCWGTETDPKGFQAPGGVSLYRTPAMIEESNKRLAELHPSIVRLVPFRSKQYEGLGMRTVASWKKAIAEGLAKRGVEYGTISGKAPR